jgi:hypothetical protein
MIFPSVKQAVPLPDGFYSSERRNKMSSGGERGWFLEKENDPRNMRICEYIL